jgi:DNA-binding Lrp family transcriptional regulator
MSFGDGRIFKDLVEKMDRIRKASASRRPLDGFDRKILAALVADSAQSYARIGEQVGLSPAAVHERVKRMRNAGHILGQSARITPQAAGKSLLAFVHVDTVGWGKSPGLTAVIQYPEVEELHSVAGDTCILLKVRTEDAVALEHFLKELYDLPEVTGTRSYIVLSSYLERPIQAEVTENWPTA